MRDLPFIDAHVHLWNLERISYPWLTPPFSDDGPNGSVEPIARTYLLDDYFADAAGWNVVGMVHVDAGAAPAAALDETRWLQALAYERGMPQAIVFYLFPRVLNTFRVDNPDMEIAAYERDTVLAELVKNGSLDICLSERYFGDPVVPQRLLGSYRLSLVYPRAWGAPPAPDDVPAWAEGRPLVTFEPGQTLRNLAFDFLGRDGAVVQASISTSGSSSVKRCVEEGLGFAIIPSWCLLDEDERLTSVRLVNLPEVRVYFGNAEFLNNNPSVRQLYEVCRGELVGTVLDAPAAEAPLHGL